MKCNPTSVILSMLLLPALILALSCGDSNPTGTSGNRPTAPSQPFPADGAQSQSTALMLTWSVFPEDLDSVTFDVYIGTEQILNRVASGLTDTIYSPRGLTWSRIYYWKVVTIDPEGNTSNSTTWHFSTIEASAGSMRYPLSDGLKWQYRRHFESFNFDPPELEDEYGWSETCLTTVNTISMNFPDGTPMVDFMESLTQCYNGEAHTYFNETVDGLYSYGYNGVGTIYPPKSPGGLRYILNGRSFSSLRELFDSVIEGVMLSENAGCGTDTLIYSDPPVRCLAYPLQPGVHWTYRTDPWLIEKEAMDHVSVTIPAGTFDALTINWLYDIDEDDQWDDNIHFIDYMTSIGIVKRTVIIEDIIVTGYESSEPLGSFDTRDDFILLDFSSSD
jgi:hypothetical protein